MKAPPRPACLRRLLAGLSFGLVVAACAQQPGEGGGEQPGAEAAPQPVTPIVLNREEALAHRQLGLGLEAAGDIAGAVEEFEAAVALDPWPLAASSGGIGESPYGDLARICDGGEPAAAAARACSRVIVSARFDRPRLARLIANRGDARLQLGEPDRAMSDYAAALKVDNNAPRGLYGRGRMRARAGAHAAAVSDFDRAIAAEPALTGARLARALSLAALGDFEAATAGYDGILASPEALAAHPDAYRGRADMRCRAGEAEAAAVDWQGWISVTPDGAGTVRDMLAAQGYLSAPAEGAFGPADRAALRAWTGAGCPAG